jgi:signal transduction histidine kinase
MKLLNFTSRYFAIALLIIIPVWAAIFYYSMLDEIYDSIDDGLDNQKGLIIRKASADSSLLTKNSFEENDYAIREINAGVATGFYDKYSDTMMYMQNEKSEEPVRMLKTVFAQHGRYFQLQVITSMVEEDDLIKQLLYSLLWLYAGLVISLLILNNYILRRIWKPFHHLLAELKRYRLDKPREVKPVPSKVEEFNMLNDTVQKLLDRNKEIFNSQKRFIEDASHELQTPLAIGISKLETLAETPNLSEEQLKILSSALDNLERLTRLNRSLLLLSKIENNQFLELSEVNFNSRARKTLDDFKDLSDFYSLETTIVDEGSCIVQMNEDLALILLSNLVKNAIIHNKQNGFVRIHLSKNKMEVKNTAAAGALDGNKIFDRFHSQNSSAASTGIGLALVKAIAQLYHFEVIYSFKNDHHITVNFSPKA